MIDAAATTLTVQVSCRRTKRDKLPGIGSRRFAGRAIALGFLRLFRNESSRGCQSRGAAQDESNGDQCCFAVHIVSLNWLYRDSAIILTDKTQKHGTQPHCTLTVVKSLFLG